MTYFTDFVELPPSLAKLHFSNLLCGVIRGALEMVSEQGYAHLYYVQYLIHYLGQIQMQVECRFVQDVLHGDTQNEIRFVFLRFHYIYCGKQTNRFFSRVTASTMMLLLPLMLLLLLTLPLLSSAGLS